MFDRDLTESEREIKNSPERRNEKAFKIVCAAICISLAGGFIYYEMNPEKFNKVSEEKININDSKEFLDNYTLSDKENEELSNNVITDNKNVIVNNNDVKPGYDEYGNKYTFSNNGMGAPNEIPTNTKVMVINPNTGITWLYGSSKKWHESTLEKTQAEIDRQQNRVVGGESTWTDEQIKQIVDNMTINLGSMK